MKQNAGRRRRPRVYQTDNDKNSKALINLLHVQKENTFIRRTRDGAAAAAARFLDVRIYVIGTGKQQA